MQICVVYVFASVHFRPHALALLLYLQINPGVHLCLCMRPCVYVPHQAYLHGGFTAIHIIYSPLGLQHGLWPAALLHSSWVSQPSPGFPHCRLLFIMHSTPLDYCRRRALHHHSLQKEAETDRKMGPGFKKTPIRVGYPISCHAQSSTVLPPFKI